MVSEFVEGGVLRQLLDNRAKQKVLDDRYGSCILRNGGQGGCSL